MNVKLDIDLVRELLLFLEQRSTHGGVKYDEIQIEGYGALEVGYHLIRMYEAGLLTGEVTRSSSTPDRIIEVMPFDLTWAGHEFLEDIRDPEIWKRTKDGARKMGGASAQFIWEIAKAYGKHVIKEKLGLSID